uniref:Putative conserved plasma membrane protein n=1 Tax=Triatoma dimidiata TaxID=72491 RepID=A0A0V0G5T1_TRIDM
MPSNSDNTEANAPAPGMNSLKAHIALHKIEMALWCTRVLTIIFTLLYFMPFGNPESSYNKALIANAATSALRLHQRHPRMAFSREFLATVILEDSCHYVLYSLIFLYVTPFSLALLPVFLFSLIHFASYSLTLLDTLGQNSWWGARLLISLVELQSRNILNWIAYTEIILMPFMVILIFMGRAGLLSPFLYYQFLTMRYKSQRNPYTRNKFHDLRVFLESLANHPQTPGFIKKLIISLIDVVCKLCPPVTNMRAQ